MMGQGMPSHRRSRGIAAGGTVARRYGTFPSKAGSGAAGNIPDERDGSERS
jgi:hypothetical protein